MKRSRYYHVTGIVLKRRNTGEADKVLTVYTREHGKISVLAKGVRSTKSKRAAHIELFRPVELSLYKGRTYDIVTEASSSGKGLYGSDNVDVMLYAYYLCEITDKLTVEGEGNDDIFELLLSSIEALVNGTKSQKEIETDMISYSHAILRILGFLGQDQVLQDDRIYAYIETITEKKIKARQVMEKMR